MLARERYFTRNADAIVPARAASSSDATPAFVRHDAAAHYNEILIRHIDESVTPDADGAARRRRARSLNTHITLLI